MARVRMRSFAQQENADERCILIRVKKEYDSLRRRRLTDILPRCLFEAYLNVLGNVA